MISAYWIIGVPGTIGSGLSILLINYKINDLFDWIQDLLVRMEAFQSTKQGRWLVT